MSKGAKRVLGVVAAIAIPFAAPFIATAIAGSAVVGGFVSAVGGGITAALGGGALGAAVAGGIGSGLVGAGLGAASAALTGGNVKQGALMGGLGSALSGGLKAFGAAKTAVTGPNGAFPTIAQANAAIPAVPGAGVTGAGGFVAGGPAAAAGGVLGGVTSKIGAALGGAVSPEMLARVATFLVSGQLSGDPDEDKLVAEYAERARALDKDLDALYNQRLAQADQIDPEARQRQSYTEAQLQGIAASDAAVESVAPRAQHAIPEVARRGLQTAALNATLAGSNAYTNAQSEKSNALTALAGMPRGNAAGDIARIRDNAASNRAGRQRGITSAISGLATGAGLFGELPKENEDPRLQAGLV